MMTTTTTTTTLEESPMHFFCFDFANGDVAQFAHGEYGYDDVEANNDQTTRDVFLPNNTLSPSSSSNSSCFSESAIFLAATEMDTWAAEHVHWLVTHMKLLLLEHLPECVAWIPSAIDRLQQEHDRKQQEQQQQQQQQQRDRNSRSMAPQHPGVLWSTQL